MTLHPFARLFIDPIYRVSYIVACSPAKAFRPHVVRLLKTTDATAAERQAVLRALDGSIDGQWDDCYGRCFRLTPPDAAGVMPFVMVWVRPGRDVSTLVHELWHAAYWVFYRRGMQFNDGTGVDEPMAYYLEWALQKALGLR